MKKIIFLSIIYFSFGFLLAQDTIPDLNGPHGGRLKSVKNYKIEMLGTYNIVYTYLYDKNLKPISVKGITGNIMFYYSGNASINAKLKPFEANGFFAEVSPVDYFYCVVNFNIFGNYISTRFENLSELAKKEIKKK
jgi:hypothetical protein